MLIKDINKDDKQFFVVFPEYDFWNNYYITDKKLVSFNDIINSFDIKEEELNNYTSLEELDIDYWVMFFIIDDNNFCYNPVSWYIIRSNVYPLDENKYPINLDDFIDFINDRYINDDPLYNW